MLNKYQLCDFFLSFFLTWLQTVAHWWRCNAWLLQWRRFPQDRQPDSVSPTLETPNRRSSNIDVFLYNNSRTAAKRAKTTHEIFFFRSRSTFSFMIKKKKNYWAVLQWLVFVRLAENVAFLWLEMLRLWDLGLPDGRRVKSKSTLVKVKVEDVSQVLQLR